LLFGSYDRFVSGWETVLAAVGGLVLGLGLGLTWGGRGERRVVRRLRSAQSRIRSSVLPVLQSRAESLGLGKGEDEEDPLEQAVDLSTRIERFESDKNLAYSDTVEVERKRLRD
jgi:hypothetical protein